ncbi:hypothetical protein MUP00_07010 [Candidatus Bathyarchaeota archaeon]|jgi:hypothetical protein|nr:hypothetical protein [Candidatus Bathyarchaeota archaeon]
MSEKPWKIVGDKVETDEPHNPRELEETLEKSCEDCEKWKKSYAWKDQGYCFQHLDYFPKDKQACDKFRPRPQ